MPITTLFLDVGGVLLTNGWDHHVRRRAVKNFNLDWAEMEERHRLTFEIHEEGKLTFEEYLNLVVFYEKRPFTRAQFRRFLCEQSKPYPAMIARFSQLKIRHGLRIAAVSNEAREVNDVRPDRGRFGDSKRSSHRLQIHLRKAGFFRIAA